MALRQAYIFIGIQTNLKILAIANLPSIYVHMSRYLHARPHIHVHLYPYYVLVEHVSIWAQVQTCLYMPACAAGTHIDKKLTKVGVFATRMYIINLFAKFSFSSVSMCLLHLMLFNTFKVK